MAFQPPKPATYKITEQNGRRQLGLSGRANWAYGKRELNCLQVFYVHTAHNHRIVCMHVLAPTVAKYTFLISHGNAADLGQMATFYYQLSRSVNVNVFSYDYSGYGDSSGLPSESRITTNIDAAMKILEDEMKVPARRIVLYGQSIGSAPTIDLAVRKRVAGVVLQSAFTSGMRLMLGIRGGFMDAFRNIDKARHIESPVLVIHGTHDQVVDIEHGLQLYKACPHTVEACWIHKAGHNDIVVYTEFYARLKQFLELDRIEMGHLTV